MTSNEPVKVEQCDRDAAAAFLRSDDCPLSVKMTLGYSPDALAQAFARHRLAALREGQASVGEGWRCFHCGEAFTDRQCAERHFGRDEGKTPACIIKGADGGLLRALRDAENQADEAVQAMHSESTDAAKAYHRARCRHTQALIAAEESGYEKGLADGRGLALAQLQKGEG